MIKSTLIATTILFAGSASSVAPATAEPAVLPLPTSEVVAQIGHLEISHSPEGFDLSLTDVNTFFVDFEFAEKVTIRIGL